jgi:hypothetical protein
MFIKIDNMYYFVNKDWSIDEIYNEIAGRMNRRFISDKEKRLLRKEIMLQTEV